MLGLSGKERHAVLPPAAQPPSPQHDAGDAAALPARSGHSSGRSGIVRPQVGCKPFELLWPCCRQMWLVSHMQPLS